MEFTGCRLQRHVRCDGTCVSVTLTNAAEVHRRCNNGGSNSHVMNARSNIFFSFARLNISNAGLCNCCSKYYISVASSPSFFLSLIIYGCSYCTQPTTSPSKSPSTPPTTSPSCKFKALHLSIFPTTTDMLTFFVLLPLLYH